MESFHWNVPKPMASTASSTMNVSKRMTLFFYFFLQNITFEIEFILDLGNGFKKKCYSNTLGRWVVSWLWKTGCVKWGPVILYHQLDWQTPGERELRLQVPRTPDQSALQSWHPVLYSRHHPQSVCSHLCDGIGQHYKKKPVKIIVLKAQED